MDVERRIHLERIQKHSEIKYPTETIYNCMTMKNTIIPIIIAMQLCNYACSTKTFYPYQQRFLFEDNYSPNNNGKIKTDGYFYCSNKDSIYETKADIFLLYNDGNFIKMKFQDRYGELVGQPIDSLKDKVYFSNKGSGIYKIDKDTLFVDNYKYISPNGLSGKWVLEHCKYQIIDSVTLKLCELRQYDKQDGNVIINDYNYIYIFAPASSLPPAKYLSMRREKWMWKNISIWKYIKEHF